MVAYQANRYCPYEVLGLPITATKIEVKNSFIKLCQLHHPDKCAESMKPTAEAKFKRIKAAYDAILKGCCYMVVLHARMGMHDTIHYTRRPSRIRATAAGFGSKLAIRAGVLPGARHGLPRRAGASRRTVRRICDGT